MGEMTREEQKAENCWAIEDLYFSDDLWEKDFEMFSEELKEFSRYQGKMGESGDTLLEVMKEMDRLNCRFEKIYVYANQRYHENTGNSKYQDYSSRASRLAMELEQAMSFAEPELMEIPEEKWPLFYKQNTELEKYRRKIQSRA